MTHSTLWLAQTQFITSLGFMLLFLALELGLVWVLLYFKLRALGRNPGLWTAAYRFWVRVFALAFVLSFAASLPVLIQFGSLWPGLMARIGDIAGPLLAAAMLCAFVFKSCFLGAMLFGQRRLSAPVHAFVVAMVAAGVTITCFFLLVLLSWTHTPDGASLINGQYVIDNGWRVLFNPSLPWYAALFMLGSLATAGFLMVGVVAVQSLRHPIDTSDRMVVKTGLSLVIAALVLQVVAVIGTGNMNAQYQPVKAAATAAYWDSDTTPELVLFALPDADAAINRKSWAWSNAGANWLARDQDGRLRGLDQFAGMQPPIGLIFWSFRIAILTGLAMLLVAGISYLRLRRADYDLAGLSVPHRRVLNAMMFSGWSMLLAGAVWLLAGAFPYAVSSTITITEIAGRVSFDSLLGGYLAYLVLYGLLLAGFFQLLGHIVRYGVVPIGRRRGRA